ncbi:MAG: dicarboxylate/amino acid:cation symporter [Pyramidobacter sp.]|nr:dicarboxylate/amino acid:cation symporter [Pyramidobacter sp.]
MVIGGKKVSLTTQVFVAMILGFIAGLLWGRTMVQLGFIGDIWLNCIKMIVVPMVICTIVTGIISQDSLSSLKRVSTRIIAYFVVTTMLACVVGIVTSTVLQPGKLANFAGMATAQIKGNANITLAGFLKGLFSTNMFKTFSDGNIVQTLVISMLLGIAILRIKNEEHKATMKRCFNSFSSMIFSLIGMIMQVSPIGVFFLMGSSFGKYGAGIFTSMAVLVGTYYLSCLLHVLIVYGGLLMIFTGINPFKFLKESAEVWIYTMSTCSSIATIPVNMKTAREKFSVPDSISGFTIPLGSQMNSDGSVLLYACVILFISQMVGQPMSLPQLLNVIFISTIMSMGGGGIPGSGIVKLMVVVQSVGLPIEVVGVIAAFYRLFDMGTTTNNCLGDLVGTIIVSRGEEKYAARRK